MKYNILNSAISKLSIAVLLGTSIIATSCRQDKGNDNIEQGTAIAVNAGINLSSKAIARTDAFKKDDTFGLFIVPCATSGETPVSNTFLPAGNYRDNVKYTMGDAAFGVDAAETQNAYYPNTLTYVDLYAISPYKTLTAAGLTDINAYPFAVQTDQTTAANVIASDIMTAQVAKKAPDANAATLNFAHRLSKVCIKFTKPDKYKGIAVTAVDGIVIGGTYTNAKIDVVNNATAPVVNTTIGINQVKACADGNTANVYNFEAILVPQDVANLEVIITITAGTKYVIKYSHPTSFTLQAKASHNMTFTMEDEKPLLTGTPTITGWDDKTLPGGDVNEETATESFMLQGVGDITGLAKAEILCSNGHSYTVTATQSGNDVKFKFNGKIAEAPELYPYTITSVELQNASSEIIGTAYTVSKTVTARTSTEITLN